jgi:alpha-ketoglutarate-dependent taurine dioxygenase
VPLRRFFETPTIESLAAYIETAKLNEQGLSARRLEVVPRGGELPLSFAQERMWFLDQMEPGNPSYNVPGALRLTGKLNHKALEQSLNSILNRHEALRTRFFTINGRPSQEIAAVSHISVQVVDLSELAEEKREHIVRRLATDEVRRPFDLSLTPLLRMRLLRLAEHEHVGLLTMHHIISDAWSLGLLIEELATLYEAFVKGEPATLPELAVQYSDYASWQRSTLKGETLEAHLAYWKRQLGGRLPVMELPTDRPRPEIISPRGTNRSYVLSSKLSEEIKALSRHEDATLFMTLLAAFQILLSRYTKREDVIVGSAVANRSHRETEQLIGFFVNTLVLRTDLSGDRTFRELLAHVRETTLNAYSHQDLPFEKLVEELRPERGLNQTPLFQIAFGLQNAPLPVIQLQDLTLDPVEFDLGVVKFDLTVWMTEQPDGLWATWCYRTDLFDEATIETMHRRYVTLLQNIVTQPENRLSALEMLTEEEKGKQTQRKRELKETNFKKFLSINPQTVNAAPYRLIKTSYRSEGETLPLVVQPGSPDVDLIGWARTNAEFVETELQKHGAILFRDFKIRELSDFNGFARTVAGELLDYREPSSPRTKVGDKIYTSTEYPATQWIQLHNEMSYSHQWPRRVFFFCMTPAAQGGATPIAHSGKVFQRLDPKIRARFIEKKVMYVRNFGDGLDLTWQHVFETSAKLEVERYCRAAGIEFAWKSSDRLRTRQIRQAVLIHPTNGENLWFNQAHAFHISTLEPGIREALLAEMREEEIPRNAFYGDGSTIEASVIDEIREVYGETSTRFSWQRGDILMIDNLLVAHGREPYTGKRQILVAMSDLTSEQGVS